MSPDSQTHTQTHIHTMNNTPTVIRIKSIHNNVAEAVKAANFDLSYNPAEGQREINRLDNPKQAGNAFRDDKPVTKAYVTEHNKVYYIYNCDITLLNEFTPFVHCLCNSPFSVVNIEEDHKEIHISAPILKKCKETRKFAASAKWILTSK